MTSYLSLDTTAEHFFLNIRFHGARILARTLVANVEYSESTGKVETQLKKRI